MLNKHLNGGSLPNEVPGIHETEEAGRGKHMEGGQIDQCAPVIPKSVPPLVQVHTQPFQNTPWDS